jgi:predicted small metal-binding protein
VGAHKRLRCDCGYLVVAEDEPALVAEIKRHAWDAHGIAFSKEEALTVVLRFELNLHGARRGPHAEGD